MDARSVGGKSHISVNPPSSYMDKYVKNNPVRTLEKNLGKTRENVQRLKEELDKANEIEEVSRVDPRTISGRGCSPRSTRS